MIKENKGWNFENSYAQLPSDLYAFTKPEIVHSPKTVLFNKALAQELGLTLDSADEDTISKWFSGNVKIEGAKSLAQAYAGHQFGHFTMLGDGRAILLGEHITPHHKRVDIQLKGSGQTPYSRRGDGRATLRSMLREYLISEAMHGLNIPTSRSLAVVASGEKVYRENIHDGAILTRVMSSHIRIGTFEYVKHFLDKETLQTFTNYVIDRHYPEIKHTENPALELLKTVMKKQMDLVVNWMRVGFIHGVMNTDNMSIAGETFDYGPCAFMNVYNPKTVFSSIDSNGRYAYGNQPRIAHWNLSCLAGTLLPLIHSDTSEAIKIVEEQLQAFPSKFQEAWEIMMVKKIGFNIISEDQSELILINDLLIWMEEQKADYTNTFIALQTNNSALSFKIYNQESFKQWVSKWQALLIEKGIVINDALQIMKRNNPIFIPRNHLVEEALNNACQANDYLLFHQLLKVVSNPNQSHKEFTDYQNLPIDADSTYKTYCGT